MISRYEVVYVARDGKKFFDQMECAKYEQEKFLKHRYVVTLMASFPAVYEVEGTSEEEAIEEARTEFFHEYDNGTAYDVEAYEVQCDDDEEED